MTEDEAKTKWCPMANPVALSRAGGTAMAGNRIVDGTKGSGELNLTPAYALCLGAACMAWRWRVEPDAGYVVTGLAQGDETVGAKPGDGYCGLAGAPA